MSSDVSAQASWEAASGLFRSLGSPLRIGIIMLLGEGARSVGDLVDALGVSQPLVSQHLKVLRDDCLVTADRQGREMSYRLMDEHVRHIVDDALRHVAEHDPRQPYATHITTQP